MTTSVRNVRNITTEQNKNATELNTQYGKSGCMKIVKFSPKPSKIMDVTF
jgi:hypothetical protein